MELHETDCKARRETLDRIIEEKRERAETKHQERCELMRMKLEHKEKELEKQRELEREKMAHEREMMVMKTELAKLQSQSNTAA